MIIAAFRHRASHWASLRLIAALSPCRPYAAMLILRHCYAMPLRRWLPGRLITSRPPRHWCQGRCHYAINIDDSHADYFATLSPTDFHYYALSFFSLPLMLMLCHWLLGIDFHCLLVLRFRGCRRLLLPPLPYYYTAIGYCHSHNWFHITLIAIISALLPIISCSPHGACRHAACCHRLRRSRFRPLRWCHAAAAIAPPALIELPLAGLSILARCSLCRPRRLPHTGTTIPHHHRSSLTHRRHRYRRREAEDGCCHATAIALMSPYEAADYHADTGCLLRLLMLLLYCQFPYCCRYWLLIALLLLIFVATPLPCYQSPDSHLHIFAIGRITLILAGCCLLLATQFAIIAAATLLILIWWLDI